MDTDPKQEVSALLAALDDTPAPEATEPGEAEEQETQAVDSAQEAQDESTEDANEAAPLVVEFDGKQWELPPGTPPELAEGVKKMADDLKADYTRKSQARAEEERKVRQEAEQLAEIRQIAAATHDKSVELTIMQRQLQQIEAVDFQTLAQTNPQQAIALQAQYNKLQTAISRTSAEIQGLASQERARIEQGRAAQKDALLREVKNLIPGYNDQINKELLEAVLDCGYTPDEVKDITDPRLLKLINLARIGRQAQQTASKGLKKAAEPPKAIKPQAPMPKKENKSALDRLKTTGRAAELINFL